MKRTHNHSLPATTALAAVLVGIAVLMLGILPASPHDALPTSAQPLGWKYPYSCCSDRDCKQAQGDVKETANGYRIVATGEIVPYGDRRIKDSPDGMFHVCQQAGDFDKGRILCLFIPPRGF